ncbi:hypothetical protein ADUPG1_007149, partial [Aduncisulcus paluster]
MSLEKNNCEKMSKSGSIHDKSPSVSNPPTNMIEMEKKELERLKRKQAQDIERMLLAEMRENFRKQKREEKMLIQKEKAEEREKEMEQRRIKEEERREQKELERIEAEKRAAEREHER